MNTHESNKASDTTLKREYKGGVFDLVPRLGYREYWHPGIIDKDVGRKPVSLKILGEDIVFFRNSTGEVSALSDYCPHRGARLSGGWRRTPGGGPASGKLYNEFKGFITCRYHGFTFDETGQCVAALTDGPNSRLQPVLKAPHYPTKTLRGIVWIWMGTTDPVPLEEDLPPGFADEAYWVKAYVRRWDLNWTLTVENSQDSHEAKIHRASIRRFWSGALFRKGRGSTWGGCRIVEEGSNYIYMIPLEGMMGRKEQNYYPVLGKTWPQHTWWKRWTGLPWRKRPDFAKAGMHPGQATKKMRLHPDRKGGVYRLPAMASPFIPGEQEHLRWAVAIDENSCRMWTFTISHERYHKGIFGWSTKLGKLWWSSFYNFWYLYIFGQGINELEDMPVQGVGSLDPDKPQTLGPTDAANAFWRRRMPLKSRDYERVWSKSATDANSLEKAEDIQLESLEEHTISAG